MMFLLLFYIPVVLALYVMITHSEQISPLWIVFLLLSIFTGGGPIVALLFLAANRKMLQGGTQQAEINMAQTPTAQTTIYPEPTTGTFVPNTTSSSTFQVTPKKAGTVLGSVVGAILWISGLLVVGFFVIVTIAAIQCSNDPKCM